MTERVTKTECLYVLQEGGLSLDDAHKVYNHFTEKGIDFLMLEFILTIQQEDKDRLASVAAELEEIS
jgi:hypothetical protein